MRENDYCAIEKSVQSIGMTAEEITKRGLTFHAWRYFCNTELQKAGLTVKKVQAVTGHKSERMTEWLRTLTRPSLGKYREYKRIYCAGRRGTDRSQ